jgi:hypothetical protein
MLLASWAGFAFSQSPAVTLESAGFRCVLDSNGTRREFVDKATGKNYLDRGIDTLFARVKCNGKEYPVTGVSLARGRLRLNFTGAGASATLKIQDKKRYLLLEVESVRGEGIEALTFLDIPLTLQGRPEEPFAACVLSLNAHTRVDRLPALMSRLEASCHTGHGLKGAKIALVGVPQADILPVLREVLSKADEMPRCTVGGPWAKERPFNRGSYLFNFGTLTLDTVDEWIAMAKSLGITQIDNHGGGAQFFRFGDFELNREKWPRGWDTYKEIVARLHKEGIGSIFHTYAFFIDKHSKYVTPVPSPYLDSFRTFTLAMGVGATDTVITVNESTKGMSTITGFFEHNSVILQIGNELVTFRGVTREPPFQFIGLTRGAFGTAVTAHSPGMKARHLKECFGLLVPDVDSPLFAEIAKNHADIVNRCGFDGLYLDAIDGASILRGGEECWYWGDRFVMEIQKHLKKPTGMEMSAMWHHCWQYRTRWQAWDYPNRGQKRFVDEHVKSINGGLLLPLHLGWWNFQVFNPPQIEPSFPDVIEYLGCRMIGYDAGISLTGSIDRENLKKIPAYRRVVDILRNYEELRRSNYFDNSVREKLREPGKEFTLFRDDAGKWRFRPVRYDQHLMESPEPWSSEWTAENPFGAQPARFRIEVLMSVAPYDSPEAVTLADFAAQDVFGGERRAADGLAFDFRPATDRIKAGAASGLLRVQNAGKTPPNASWTRLDRTFTPWLDLSKQQALGVWVYGDGRGELLGFRLESPKHISYGAVADRYITVDFTGWRYCELVETESVRWSDHTWNDGKWLYNVYRETIDFGHVESLGVWMNDIPSGKTAECLISPVKALPLVSNTVTNPSLTVGGKTLVFPVEMSSGSYLEFNSPGDCKLYGPKGEFLADVKPQGDAPSLATGKNAVKFQCGSGAKLTPRVKVTVISHGEAL